MIAGETRTVRHTETGESAFVFDATPELTVTYPDGTTDTPAVTVSPGASSTTQTLSANVTFQAGVHRLVWDMDIGDQDPIRRIEEYFAAWSDVYSTIRELLSRTVTQLPDTQIDRALGRTVRWLTRLFPCIDSYDALTGNDRYAFDDALAYFAAVSIRPTLGSTAVAGEVKRKKLGGAEIEYTTSGSVSASATIAKDWTRQGWEALLGVSCITTTPYHQSGMTGAVMPVSVLSPLGGYEDCEEYATLRGLT